MRKKIITPEEINLFNWMDKAPMPKPEDETMLETTTEIVVKPTKQPSIVKQYEEMKKKHPDAILLFRVNDFYELFGDDATDASKILGITLTSRANGATRINLAGFPHHALDIYLPKLVRAGRRVAICEQLENPYNNAK